MTCIDDPFENYGNYNSYGASNLMVGSELRDTTVIPHTCKDQAEIEGANQRTYLMVIEYPFLQDFEGSIQHFGEAAMVGAAYDPDLYVIDLYESKPVESVTLVVNHEMKGRVLRAETRVGGHSSSERLEDHVAEEVSENVPPEANDEVGRQLGKPGLDHVGRVPKGSTELAVGMRTYFLPVFCLPGLMSTDLKKAKAYSTGLLA